MDIFICYSFKDNVDIESMIQKSFIDNISYVRKSHWPFCWRKNAKHKIMLADCVLCLVTESVYCSNKIAWELKTAIENGKEIFYIKYDKSAIISEILKQHGTEIKTFDVFSEIKKHNNEMLSKELISPTINLEGNEKNKDYFFEQYKIFVNTSEELGKKRQKMHSFFVALNGGIFSVIGLVVKNINNVSNVPIGTVLIFLIASIMGCFSAYSWKRQTVSYKQLSRGKFKIINNMEKYLPVAVFKAEWRALAYGKDEKVYSAFTQNEENIPGTLMSLYIFFIIVGVLYVIKDVCK